MKKIQHLILLILSFLILFSLVTPALAQTTEGKATIYFFWGDGCPHCAKAHPYLQRLADTIPGVELREFEVWNNADNRVIFANMAAKFGFEARYVPTIFIGERYWQGYAETQNPEIEETIQSCLVNGCVDAGEGVDFGTAPQPTPQQSGSTVTGTAIPPTAAAAPQVTPTPALQVRLPIVGEVDLGGQSLTLSTVLIALVDGFNPCSLWVLSMLMALTLHTGSRKKILLIGLVFLTITAAIYALFIAGLFTLFTFISFVGWVQILVAGVALVFALINIKDYFWYKEGVSLTIADSQKPGIYQRMRRVLAAGDSILALLGATIVLAAGVSLVEFSCTSGFPVLWTNLLVSQGADPPTFVTQLLLYMLIYQLDEIAIFLGVVFTLRASKLEEKHGRMLKLVGGMLMLTLALVMLINPALMNDLGMSLLIFGAAFLAAGSVLLVHRVILPRLGIWIGSERPAAAQKSKRKN